MVHQYLDLVHQGKNEWWRYLISVLIILFFYQVIGPIPLIVLGITLALDENPDTDFDLATLQFDGINPIWVYLAINFIFIALLIGLWIAVHFIHGRRLMTLVTPVESINWKRVGQGFGLYLLLYAVVNLISLAITGREVAVTFSPGQFLVFLPLALILTPIQTTVEEMLFRGYFMQGISLKIKHPWALIVITSLLFMVPHLLNPEVEAGFVPMAILYFLVGAFLAFITIKDKSLELAIGSHAANNLFIALFLNYENSALPTPSILTAAEIIPLSSLISFLVVSSIFCVSFFGRRSAQS
ncbi:CPBP family intramembrane glutamic endopeptidase [Nodosilinea sp. P-1105]|uniref:CPBP family intramembrane glutamic endopeptidase n=1 Tax=Nodosilinea sp. P-1105 TaxID=2546229 RepID=UPI00146C112C|nr:CPBP family intramembrane glutamic endopeptidase [Nodosilinea sp. P-1105]NMF85743.1 CPBP family intramembrane metalloprotease [Nodosilinea sp. P-1105]